MYHAPVTASYNNNVWAKIGRIVNPLVHRYAPFLNTPISAAQRWMVVQVEEGSLKEKGKGAKNIIPPGNHLNFLSRKN